MINQLSSPCDRWRGKKIIMNTVKLIITSVVYLLVGILELYAYYLCKNGAIGVLAFFTLGGFIITFYCIVLDD